MSIPGWHEAPIAKSHDRENFDCGDQDLNEFLSRHARRSHSLGGAKTFLAIENADNKTVFGYYTVAPASLAFERAPDIIRRGLARHEVPVFRLARLAVDLKFQGQGLGGQLLLAAGRRCFLTASQVGGVAMLIDAKNKRAAKWYAGYGAVPITDSPLCLLLPFKTIHDALMAAGKL